MSEKTDVWRLGAVFVKGMMDGKHLSRRKVMDVLASNQTSTTRFLEFSGDIVFYAVRGEATGKDAARLAEHVLRLAVRKDVHVQQRSLVRLKETVDMLSRFEQVLNRSAKPEHR